MFKLGLITFAAAAVLALAFLWIRIKKTRVNPFTFTARRVIIEYLELVTPAALIFYGLALLNVSKYTINEVRILAISFLLIGSINCLLPQYGLALWALGFGMFHILFGVATWFKYERVNSEL